MEKEKVPYAKTVIVIMIIQTIIIFILIGMLNTKDSYSQEKIDYLVNKVNQLSTNEPVVIEQEIDYDKLAESISSNYETNYDKLAEYEIDYDKLAEALLEKLPKEKRRERAEKEFGEKFEEATSYFGEATSYFGEKAKDLAIIINDKIQEKITEEGVETTTP